MKAATQNWLTKTLHVIFFAEGIEKLTSSLDKHVNNKGNLCLKVDFNGTL